MRMESLRNRLQNRFSFCLLVPSLFLWPDMEEEQISIIIPSVQFLRKERWKNKRHAKYKPAMHEPA